ncbi:MAG: nicotinamide-nucleotide amidohydrolase family protein [Chloroflexota bacterium]|nr:nicotinamide-nucleotide amidohydrolase family protein [Chloroflexota bacterium]
MKPQIAEEIGNKLRKSRLTISVAESATGGLIASLISDIAGSSDYLRGGIVAYDNQIKEKVLGVAHQTLEKHGAVSCQTAAEMSQGIRKLMETDIGISDTGIAGPTGATPNKPIGLFYFGLSCSDTTHTERHVFSGNRVENKQQAAGTVLRMLNSYLDKACSGTITLEAKHVVTCFLEYKGKILLLRRSQRVGTYQGKWAGVSGYIEQGQTSFQQALREIEEETHLIKNDIVLVKEGLPLEVFDKGLSRKWIIHPYRFSVLDPNKIEIDWEHSETQWILPRDIESLSTVPQLKDAWERVA